MCPYAPICRRDRTHNAESDHLLSDTHGEGGQSRILPALGEEGDVNRAHISHVDHIPMGRVAMGLLRQAEFVFRPGTEARNRFMEEGDGDTPRDGRTEVPP
jgi:hypothetical protein